MVSSRVTFTSIAKNNKCQDPQKVNIVFPHAERVRWSKVNQMGDVMYHVIMCRVCVPIVPIQTKQCFFLSVFVALRVVVNYTKPLSVVTETPERVPFGLSLSYKIFRTAGKNNVNVTLRRLPTQCINIFIHIILQSSTYFEHHYAHLQEVKLYTYSIW